MRYEISSTAIDDEAAIRALEDRFATAFNAGDVEKFIRLTGRCASLTAIERSMANG